MGLRTGRIVIWVGFLLLLCAGQALADPVAVGVLSFDLLPTGSLATPFGLDIFNATQPGGGSTIATFLSFNRLTLTLDLASGTTTAAVLIPDSFGGFSTGPVFAAGDVLSATLTGTFFPTSVTLTDGSTANIDSGFTSFLGDPTGALVDGDFAVINANTVVQGVPEPSSFVSLGLPLFLLVFLFRWNSRCRALLDAAISR